MSVGTREGRTDMAIDWDHITQPRFDRIVEALVHRLYAEDAEVKVMNGRGGDGGIDIKVTVDGRVRIYQLKYFPDGFPGSYQGRRAGIKRSFKKALEHDPDDWVLVVLDLLPRQPPQPPPRLVGGLPSRP
ncbi:hypothetical protein [Streptomyces sp. NPDC096033]|uniref:hypothetical protein n=1 Tax=Streptomyces sp. NPDC096033 TaxID=3366071 RepID=UPI00381B9741